MLEASPQPAEAAAKITTPSKNINRRPKRSPNEPPTKISAARNNPYDSTTHCRSTTVARKFACSAGNATFTTVLSINAMLDPSIVATRIHFRASAAQGTPPPAASITASSHAVLIPAMDAPHFALGSLHFASNRLAGTSAGGATPNQKSSALHPPSSSCLFRYSIFLRVVPPAHRHFSPKQFNIETACQVGSPGSVSRVRVGDSSPVLNQLMEATVYRVI